MSESCFPNSEKLESISIDYVGEGTQLMDVLILTVACIGIVLFCVACVYGSIKS